MEKINGLDKTQKLKSRKQIDALFEQRKSFAIFPIRVFYAVLNENKASGVQVGVGCSKKFFKRAVDRNKVKRLLRESYRTQKQELLNWADKHQIQVHLFFLYTQNQIIGINELQAKMEEALKKIPSLCSKLIIDSD